MPSIFIPSTGPSAWRRLLGDPTKHWVTGYSARTLAHCWESAQGFPLEIAGILEQHDALAGVQPLFIFPEWKVDLPPRGRAPSQNDVWVLGRSPSGLISLAIEGKVNEPFGETLGEWQRQASPGKQDRLQFLIETLGLTAPLTPSVRYQLLHRAASAIVEAERCGATHAVMLVHSFSPDNKWFDDFAAFCGLFGANPRIDQLVTAQTPTKMPLHLGWVHGDERYLAQCTCCGN